MSRSQALFHLQQLDSELDKSDQRIQEIDQILQDSALLDAAMKSQQVLEGIHAEKTKKLQSAEHEVSLQTTKIEQNQQKLYSGVITNPKELEDLQLESNSLNKYLQVLEERQLEAMLEADQSHSDLQDASARVQEITNQMEHDHALLKEERIRLESEIAALSEKRSRYLENEDLPDLAIYQSLRSSSGGLAVSCLVDSSCAACGSSIPSAIDQAAKSSTKLAFCPTCKRILHPC